jgi:hypothetical protein
VTTTPEVHLRYPSHIPRRLPNGITVNDLPWLEAIKTANGIDPEMFRAPEHTGPWWAGGSVEEYPHARVIHRDDDSVSIVPKTDHGADVLRQVQAIERNA